MAENKWSFFTEKIKRKSRPYNSFLEYLINNSCNLKNFIISKIEIENQFANIENFEYDVFIEEFNKISDLQCYEFIKNPYCPYIFHIITKNRGLSPKYSFKVIERIKNEGYNTKIVQSIISSEENLIALVRVKLGIEKFAEIYKNQIFNKTISSKSFFRDFVYPNDKYAKGLKKFNDDYNEYISRYTTLDNYVDEINKDSAIQGFRLIKKDTDYAFVSVPKKIYENSYGTLNSNETKRYCVLNLNSTKANIDGSYGFNVLKDPISGRFYSIPSYDDFDN